MPRRYFATHVYGKRLFRDLPRFQKHKKPNLFRRLLSLFR